MKSGYVYIMANRKNGTIYIGVTSDLMKRVHEHREGSIGGFTKRYSCRLLVWFEAHDDLEVLRKQEDRAEHAEGEGEPDDVGHREPA